MRQMRLRWFGHLYRVPEHWPQNETDGLDTFIGCLSTGLFVVQIKQEEEKARQHPVEQGKPHQA